MSQQPAPTIETDRLALRRFAPDDAAFVLELHGNPDLVRFIPSQAQRDLADAASWIETVAEKAAPGRGWWCVELRDGSPVGAVVLQPIRHSVGRDGDEVEIGWRWHAAHTGSGLATEAAAALLAAAHAGGLERVIAVTDPANAASQAVCRRIGMRPLGETDAYYDATLSLFESVTR